MSQEQKVEKLSARLKVLNNKDGSIKETKIVFSIEVHDVLISFLSYLKDNEFARNTRIAYYINIRKMLNKRKYVSEQMIFNYLRKSNGLVQRSSIKKFLRFIKRETKLSLGDIEYPRFVIHKKVVEAISMKEVYAIIKRMPEKFKLLTELLFIGGLRENEGIRAYVGDLSFKRWLIDKADYGHLLIVHAKRNKQRLVPLNPKLMKKLYDYVIKRDGELLENTLLFNYDLDWYMKKLRKQYKKDNVILTDIDASARYIEKVRKNFERTIRLVSKETIGKHISSHILRASRATQLDELNVSIAKIRDLLGHDSISTTDRYIKASPKRLTDTLRKVEM